MNTSLADTELLILSGGKGTRLSSVWADKPKILAPVNGRPYFDWLLEAMYREGFRHFRFLLGMGADLVVEHISTHAKKGMIEYEIETSPLGTGGAVQKALEASETERVFVANGDSYCRIDYPAMLQSHIENQAVGTLGIVHVEKTSDYGCVVLQENMEISAFLEKDQTQGSGYVNSGVYILEKKCLDAFPDSEACSLEHDVFPTLSKRNSLYGFKSNSDLLDIGTPDRLQRAQSELAGLINNK